MRAIRRLRPSKVSTAISLILSVSVCDTIAADLTLEWNPVSGSSGYELQYGTASRTYTSKQDVPAGTRATVTGLAAGTSYFFAVRAHASNKTVWSALSTEISGKTSGTATDTVPPTVSAVAPTNGATGIAVSAAVTATFSESLNAATVSNTTLTLSDSSGTSVGATVQYDTAARRATLKPNASLKAGTRYTAVVRGGSTGVKDSAGNALASNYSWSFTTATGTSGGGGGATGPCTTPCSLWTTATRPSLLADSDTAAVELGVKFRSSVNGKITGVRFYKGPTNTGTHIGSLWSASGALLARGTFTNETASGWQQLNFASPVSITANTTYVASYHTNVGRYAVDQNYFTSNYVKSPLSTSANAGVYRYGGNAFPSSSYKASNYWVDVLMASDSAATAAASVPTELAAAASADASPVAGFTASRTTGTVPLTATFTDTSTGTVESREWAFGDGTTAQGSTAVHTYTAPGTYDVGLTVTGPGGSLTELKPGLVTATAATDAASEDQSTDTETTPANADAPIEVGQASVDHRWTRVDFGREFVDPVVIVGPLGASEDDPAVVRVRGIDSTGFEVRVEEWGYLDGQHAAETVSYLVVERGKHQLPDGGWIEADRIAGASGDFGATAFSAPFALAPVVLTTVTSANQADAVTSRVRSVQPEGFELRLQQQEANAQTESSESVDYVAWEPSSGTVAGVRFEAGLTLDEVTDKPHTLAFKLPLVSPPALLANMQTADGNDTATLRWSDKAADSVEIWVDEEASRDSETSHTTETAGYLIFELED